MGASLEMIETCVLVFPQSGHLSLNLFQTSTPAVLGEKRRVAPLERIFEKYIFIIALKKSIHIIIDFAEIGIMDFLKKYQFKLILFLFIPSNILMLF